MARPQRLEAGDYRDLVRRALAEDLAGGDITTDAIFGQSDRARGTFLAKSPCTLAGLDVALEAFSQLDRGRRCRAGISATATNARRALTIGQ